MFKELKNLYIVGIILMAIFITGVVGYIQLENYTLIEAVYMTIITMSTVGYEEVHPLSNEGMILTMALIVVSLGLFAYMISSVTRIFIDGEYKKLVRKYKSEKKVNKMKNHVIICGFGRNGRQATIELIDQNINVIVLERSNQVMLQDINESLLRNTYMTYINGDAAHEESLEKANIKKAKAIITTLPNDAENLLIVLTAREISPDVTIISRASDEHSYSKLLRAGANNVIMPDIVGGSRMAKLVTRPDIVEFLEMIMLREGVDVNIEEIHCKDLAACFINTSISKIDIRRKTGANLIGLKLSDNTYLFNPPPEYELKPEDKLFVLGTAPQIEKLKDILAAESLND